MHDQPGWLSEVEPCHACTRTARSHRLWCSIHVSGEGEGSKATLIAWLKRQATLRFGQQVVGRHVWVCWLTDAVFYKGLILTFSPETGKHKARAGLFCTVNCCTLHEQEGPFLSAAHELHMR